MCHVAGVGNLRRGFPFEALSLTFQVIVDSKAEISFGMSRHLMGKRGLAGGLMALTLFALVLLGLSGSAVAEDESKVIPYLVMFL